MTHHANPPGVFHNGGEGARCACEKFLFSLFERQVMALLSVLTPVLAAVLCLVVGLTLVKSRETKNTSRGKSGASSTVEHRPWVDQDLQDDTEGSMKGRGKEGKNREVYSSCLGSPHPHALAIN